MTDMKFVYRLAKALMEQHGMELGDAVGGAWRFFAGDGWPDINFEQAREGVLAAAGGLEVSEEAAKEIYYSYYAACYE